MPLFVCVTTMGLTSTFCGVTSGTITPPFGSFLDLRSLSFTAVFALAFFREESKFLAGSDVLG